MRKTLSAFVLVLALGSTVFAGDILSPPAPIHGGAADTSLVTRDTNSLSSEIQSTDYQTADLFTEAALTVFDSVLALF